MTSPELGSTLAPAKKRPKAGIIAMVVVLVAAFGWLLMGNLDKNVVFFLTPNELLAKGTEGIDVPVRLGGQVKAGTVTWDEKALDLRFDIVDTDGKGTIHVQSKGKRVVSGYGCSGRLF